MKQELNLHRAILVLERKIQFIRANSAICFFLANVGDTKPLLCDLPQVQRRYAERALDLSRHKAYTADQSI
ncbi:hypothetical protein [Cognatishimia activa]|uniref:Uncharacterized protein n=1 Tax=Cognatishimia activa TaxID=1715691 RepID=A0A0P1IV49_9RHOB|nr:hypothetical protein [Cognatishimia activa]CUJ09207.1 hypothetical protein TA5113_02270 [Cognatishimia activa]CUK25204.1 hypothetical protein TA5114_00995 [Cognatishimia activa]